MLIVLEQCSNKAEESLHKKGVFYIFYKMAPTLLKYFLHNITIRVTFNLKLFVYTTVSSLTNHRK